VRCSTPVPFHSRKGSWISLRFSCLMWVPASLMSSWNPCPSGWLLSAKKSRGMSHYSFRLCAETAGSRKAKQFLCSPQMCYAGGREEQGLYGFLWQCPRTTPDRRSPEVAGTPSRDQSSRWAILKSASMNRQITSHRFIGASLRRVTRKGGRS
jgi:hypothetical protein